VSKTALNSITLMMSTSALLSSARVVGSRVGFQALRAATCRFLSSVATGKEHIVVALGGNALLKRGEKMTIDNQRNNISEGIAALANIVRDNKVTLVHGNGPQVGLLLLESAAYEQQTGLKQMSLDVLDAETEGMIGYLIEQELQSYLPNDRGLVTILSQIVCDPNDKAFKNPTKFIGPIYTKVEAEKLHLPVKPDGDHYRRVVPSPMPVKLIEHQMQAIRQLSESNCVVICGGGGGIPIVEDPITGKYRGIEAVIDKDRAATMIGISLNAQGLLILTDVPAVAINFGKPDQKFIKMASTDAILGLMDHFPDGSMGPKIESAVEFVSRTGGWAKIGSLPDADKILAGEAGTTIKVASPAGDCPDIEFFPSKDNINGNAPQVWAN
jgi:carbamate kinase